MADVAAALADREGASLLAHGLGRSYGDAALNGAGRSLLMPRLDRLLAFEEDAAHPQTAWLTVEAGVSLKTILDLYAPRGWFLPVAPGTQFVTVGGAIANDVHGKNHAEAGSFGDHVRRVELLTAAGEVVVCDAETEPALFWATMGGLGLTGLILRCTLRLRRIASPFLEVESVRADDLDSFLALSDEATAYPHVAGWLDANPAGGRFGRGVVLRGRHAADAPHDADAPDAAPRLAALTDALKSGLKRGITDALGGPIEPPAGLLNPQTMRAFNAAYFHKAPAGLHHSRSHYLPFFFHLDAVGHWNRAYGAPGFLQYQMVVPAEADHRATRAVLAEVQRAGFTACLAVTKTLGEGAHGGLSFPGPGLTLALDFPNTGEDLRALLTRLDALVAEAGGRVYLAKDARLARADFRRMYPGWAAWKATRDAWDPAGVFQSDLGRRLGLCGED